jgi:membrane protease YdiL (CAAX protease family)
MDIGNDDKEMNTSGEAGQESVTETYSYQQPGHIKYADHKNDIGGPGKPRRFGVRTVLIPLVFMFVHFLAINVVAMVFLLALLVINSGGSIDMNLLADVDYLNELIISKNSQITVFYALALLPVYLIYLTFARRRHPEAVLLSKPRMVNDLLPSLAIMIGAMGFTNLYFVLLEWLSSVSPLVEGLMNDYIELSSMAFTSEGDYLWLILGVGIAAPVVEELLFRGIIQGELRRAMPEWLAVVIQALAFAIFHMQPIQSSYVFLPGLLLGAAYAWSRSLWVPIVMHIFFNLLGSLVPSLIQSDEMLVQIVGLTQMAVIPVAVAAAVYMFLSSRKKKIQQQEVSAYESTL